MFKVNNKDTTVVLVSLLLTLTYFTPFSSVSIVGVVLVSLLLTLTHFTPCSSVSIVNFEHIIAGWIMYRNKLTV